MIFNRIFGGGGKTLITLGSSSNPTPYVVTQDGKDYMQYTIVKSDTQTIKGPKVQANIWCCGGGANGLYNPGLGGGGGYFKQLSNVTLSAGTYTVAIGGAQGATSQRKGSETALITATGATNQNGASGGGGFCSVTVGPGAGKTFYNPGTGGGATTLPFNDGVNFKQYHCAGGGGSSDYDYWQAYGDDDSFVWGFSKGGDAGSNGSSGKAATSVSSSSSGGTVAGGAGGTYGGGTGSPVQTGSPTKGTYYGAGGGGRYTSSQSAAGYQGVMYIRVPAEDIVKPAPEGTEGYRIYRITVTNSWNLTANALTKGYAYLKDLILYNGNQKINVSKFDYIGYDTNNGNLSEKTSKLFDDNSSTAWTGQTLDASPVWAEIIFPRKVKATSFELIIAQSGETIYTAPNDFQIYGSDDNENFVLIYNGANIGKNWSSNIRSKTFPLTYYAPGDGNGYQYYRLTVSNSYFKDTSSTASFAHINEIRLYNRNTLLDYGTPVYSCVTDTSDTGLVGEPQYAFDNSDYTSWYSFSRKTAWVQIQLPARREITAFTITSNLSSYIPNNFIFAGSNDGTNFTTLYTATGVGSTWGSTPTWRFTIGGGKEAVPEYDWTKGTASTDRKYMYYRLLVGLLYSTGGTASGSAGAKSTALKISELGLYNGENKISYTGAVFATNAGSLSVGNEMFDNDVTTYYTCSAFLNYTDTKAAWVQVQFPETKSVSAFDIYTEPKSTYSGNHYFKNLSLYGSNNGKDFVLLKAVTNPTWTFGNNGYLKVTI